MRNFAPLTPRQAQELITRKQPAGEPFAGGMYGDLPASSIPDNAISDSIGYIPFPKRLEPCGGCLEWSDLTLPTLPGRTGYALVKHGRIVTKSSGQDFTDDDVGNWIIHDDGTNDLIETLINTTQVSVKDGTTRAASSAAAIRGPLNGKYYHRAQNKILIHIDTRLFYTTPEFIEYTECYCISYRGLGNSASEMDEIENDIIIFNANGLFKVNLLPNDITYYKINSPIPTELITGTPVTPALKYGYKYTYSLARITGSSQNRTRLTTGSYPVHETGPCKYNADLVDYAEIWAGRPVGDESSLYEILTGATLAAPYNTPSGWSGISNGQFTIAINGTSYNVAVDFTAARSMSEVAARIQAALRAILLQGYSSAIYCEYIVDHFVITNLYEGGTLSETSAGNAGTDIGATAMKCQAGTGTSSQPTYTAHIDVATLDIPLDSTDDTPERHHTHFSVYRTLDIGDNGVLAGNNEEQFVWVSDVPVAKAFVAYRTDDIVTATSGDFAPEDVGCRLRFADGTEVSIKTWISDHAVETETSGSITSQAAAIGGSSIAGTPIRVMEVSQTAQALLRTAGSTFTVADIGKTIFLSDGSEVHVIEYIDANNVTVLESQTVDNLGACMDPQCRNFKDTVSDDILRARITDLSLLHRFTEPIPDSGCSIGAVIPALIFTAASEDSRYYYSVIPLKKEYLIGYYNPRQYSTVKDAIQKISQFPNVITIYCSHSTYVVPTNTFVTFDINSIVQIAMISGQICIDEQIGIKCPGAVCRLPNGTDWMVTSEPAIRIFDGSQFTANLGADRVMKKLLQIAAGSMYAMYDPFNGVTLFGEFLNAKRASVRIFQDNTDLTADLLQNKTDLITPTYQDITNG
jgi:hypothetical protein